jgi:acyl-coenzyme A thioesterase PaaI-like protein
MATLRPREGPEAEERRDAVVRLAAATRALADAVATTGVERAELDEVSDAIEQLTRRLAAVIEDDAYSGLIVLPVDQSKPETVMPLNPIIGHCSPVRPDVELRCVDGEVRGTATFTRRFVGPPGHAHGGISAMLADQLTAVAPLAVGVPTVTKSLTLRYLRALPLDEELELWGVCEPDGDRFRARFTVRARGEVAVDGTAELVTFRDFARRTDRRGG